MASPDMLVMRIRTAAAEIEAAAARGDVAAGWKASQKYESAMKQLEDFEAEQAERNARVLAALERRANGWGELSYAKIMQAGVPVEVMKARGWEDIQGRAGMFRKAEPNGPTANDDPEPEQPEAG